MKSYKLIIKPVQELPCSKYHIVYNLKDYFEDVDSPEIPEMVRLISDWTDEKPNKLFTCLSKDIVAAFNAITTQLNSYKPQKPKQSIGDYVFIMDYEKMSAGWWNHINHLDMKNNPLELLGLVYLEKGRGYAEVDKHDNVINPVSERKKTLVDEMSLADFMDIAAFFLNQYVILKELHSGLNINQAMEELKSQRLTDGKTH